MLSCQHKFYEIVLSAMYSLPFCALFCIPENYTFPSPLLSAFLNNFGQRKVLAKDLRAGKRRQAFLLSLSLFFSFSLSFSLCLYIYISVSVSLAEFLLHLICDSVPLESPCFPGSGSHQGCLPNAISFQQLSFTTPSLWPSSFQIGDIFLYILI